jgi:GTPase SAR1 family protein
LPIVKVFDDLVQLLILGAPGSGKTTLLLELAHELLDRAENDPEHPIPVVFPLSRWAESRKPLAEWLADELNLRYDVPLKIGQEWVEAGQVLPLLDGLDEVEAAHRAACVEAINAYRRDHGFLPLVICCRMADYDALARPLRLHGAIVVQPLTPQQVEYHLTEIEPTGERVRQAIREDPSLWELLDTPLMLNITTVAYAGRPDRPSPTQGTLRERRESLFGAYVDQMFRRRSAERLYAPAQTVHWLAWLARQMESHSQTVFYLERLQFDWLPRVQAPRIEASFRLLIGLIFGFYGWLVAGLGLGLARAALGGLVVVMCVGLRMRFGYRARRISCVDAVHWSLTESLAGIDFEMAHALTIGLVVGVLYALLAALDFGLFGGAVGLLGGLAFGLVLGLLSGLNEGLSSNEVDVRSVPNQGVHRSARNALVVGMCFGIVSGLGIGLVTGLGVALLGGLGVGLYWGLKAGLIAGLTLGLGTGMWNGGEAYLKYLVLRLWLSRNGSTPLNYVEFLDYAAKRILLRKVGGGCAFLHRMLLEYFAARYVDPASTSATSAKPSPIET